MSKNNMYVLKVSRFHPVFINRINAFFSLDEEMRIEATLAVQGFPNDVIICDGCNRLIEEPTISLLCSDAEGNRQIHRCECSNCLNEFFGELDIIDESELNIIEKVISTLTNREKNFMINFFISKADDEEVDRQNFHFDLKLYAFDHSPQLAFLYPFICKHSELLETISTEMMNP